jgi:small subunit ribosomal protein S15
MSLSSTEKAEVIANFRLSEGDVGSPPVQIAILTTRIKQLTAHLQSFRKDKHSQRGLLKMVSQRRRLMTYLKRKNPALYQSTLNALNLRG